MNLEQRINVGLSKNAKGIRITVTGMIANTRAVKKVSNNQSVSISITVIIP